jgi:hypothetical protein
MQPKRPLNIDGVRQREALRGSQPYAGPGAAAAGLHRASMPVQTMQTALTRPFQTVPRENERATLWDRLQLPLLILGGMLAGFMVQSLAFGLVLIAAYGVVALAVRIPSRVSFMLAFMSLVTVMVLLVAKPDTTLAGNFSTYTFLLLVIGVIALAIEARPPKRRKRPNRRSIRG